VGLTKKRSGWKWATVAVGVLGLALAWRQLPADSWLTALIGWTEDRGAGGMLVFTGVYTIAMVLCVWGTPFTLAAGMLFGLWWGAIIATFSATAGSTLAFVLARYLGRDRVEQWVKRYPRFKAIDAAVGERGWTIVFLTRLSPIVPFSLSNYMFGVTRVSLAAFVGASLLAIAPGSFVVAYLGHIGRLALLDHREAAGPLEYVVLVGGLIFTGAIVAYLAYIAKSAISRIPVEEGPGG
jgi:uncharacterized membrane protein YdjX (TVP38/TMEM64 family)